MSISKATSKRNAPDDFSCPRCGATLLPQAAFCSSCGERLDNQKVFPSLLQNERDIAPRYRITSLVRRRPYVNLYFALDNQQSLDGQRRMVAIRDFDTTLFDDKARAQAIKLVEQEYDSLRLWQLPNVLPVVDLRYFKGHLFVISGYPLTPSRLSTTGESENTKALTGTMHRLYSLQDFLQSGQGLPSEQQALKWIGYLCQALDGLHRHQIIIGELDPYTIILNENSDSAEPALMISWLSPQLQKLLHSSQASTRFWSYFCAPESLQGKAEPRSDIYSLGAILYLLLTGTIPNNRIIRTRGRMRSPRNLNGRVSAHVSDCVMQALSIEPAKRFQNALEMSEALFNPRSSRFQTLNLSHRDEEVMDPTVVPDEDSETMHIVPLSQQQLDRGKDSHPQSTISSQIPRRPLIPRPTPQPEEASAIKAEWKQEPIAPLDSTPIRATPIIETNVEEKSITPGEQLNGQQTNVSQEPEDNIAPTDSPPGLFKQLQRFILGRQQHAMVASALIESPLAVRLDQVFTLRVNIMGRDEPAISHVHEKGVDTPPGLSRFVHGNTVAIEVRSVLNQNFTYVVQQATATIPAAGYVAELLIPIKPLSSLPDGRRERLLISFLDEQRRPLYKKPFMVEVFVSNHIKRGHEGYNVLTIPQ